MTILRIEHIVRDPNIMGGSPRIAETRVRVEDVAAFHITGSTVEYIADAFDLTPGQVYAALSYYYDHREEIEADVQRQIEFANKFLAEGHAATTEDLKARIRAQDPHHPLLRQDSAE